jgi:hypothetical protein
MTDAKDQWHPKPPDGLTPAQAVVQIRETPFTSVQEERDAVRAVDQAVQEKIRQHELYLISRATGEVAELKPFEEQIEDVTARLQEIAKAARRGDEIDLQEWSILDSQSKQLVERALNVPGQMADLLSDLSDPLSALSNLLDKYTALPRHLPLSR